MPDTTSKQSGFNKNSFMKGITPYIFISPFYIGFLIFGAFPILFSLFLSFQRWNGIRAMKFIGFGNYTYLLGDKAFWESVARTFKFLIFSNVPIQIMALFFAFVLTLAFIKLKGFFKSVFFMPYITSYVSIALVFGLLYGTQYGFFNFILQTRGIKSILDLMQVSQPISWLRGDMTIISISILAMWRWTGWYTVLYLTGMQTIDDELYDAARVDGASWNTIFFRITLPLLKRFLFFGFTMAIIGGMQMFDDSAVLLGRTTGGLLGGADHSGESIAIYLYNQAFGSGYFGTAAAASYLLFIIVLILTGVNSFLFKEKRAAI